MAIISIMQNDAALQDIFIGLLRSMGAVSFVRRGTGILYKSSTRKFLVGFTLATPTPSKIYFFYESLFFKWMEESQILNLQKILIYIFLDNLHGFVFTTGSVRACYPYFCWYLALFLYHFLTKCIYESRKMQ